MAKGKSGGGSGQNTVMSWSILLSSLALFLLIMLILFGNLSGNVGFAANTAGANNTDNFIANYTASVLNVGKQFPVVGTIIGIALLLLILIGILVFALRKMGAVSSQSGGGNFG